jgi:hypothetical protein
VSPALLNKIELAVELGKEMDRIATGFTEGFEERFDLCEIWLGVEESSAAAVAGALRTIKFETFAPQLSGICKPSFFEYNGHALE